MAKKNPENVVVKSSKCCDKETCVCTEKVTENDFSAKTMRNTANNALTPVAEITTQFVLQEIRVCAEKGDFTYKIEDFCKKFQVKTEVKDQVIKNLEKLGYRVVSGLYPNDFITVQW